MTQAALTGVVASDESRLAQAQVLADRLELPLAAATSGNWRQLPGSGLVLYVTATGLALAIAGHSLTRPLQIDFTAAAQLRRARRASNRNEALARAIGLRNLDRPRVIDTTAGLGRDSFSRLRILLVPSPRPFP